MHTAKNGLVLEVFCKEARRYLIKRQVTKSYLLRAGYFYVEYLLLGRLGGGGAVGGG